MILYEYMPNGSLEDVLHDEAKRSNLDWEARRRILLDIAYGLQYLHELSGKNIAHLDIKPSNILLDGDMTAKIADFGTARYHDQLQTTPPLGTFGFMDPHLMMDSSFPASADIYSFGVLLLVLISGREVQGFADQDPHHATEHIIKWAWLQRNEDGASFRLKDYTHHCTDESFMRMLKIAFLCVQMADYQLQL